MVYSFQQFLDEPDTRKRMIDPAGSLRNGHKNEETAGTEQKLDSSERNNNSIDKTFRAHSIDKQKEKRVDDMMVKRKKTSRKNVSTTRMATRLSRKITMSVMKRKAKKRTKPLAILMSRKVDEKQVM